MSKRINSEPLPSYPFVKSRDLVGKTFTTLSRLRQGETKQGLNYFIDVIVDGVPMTLSFGASGAMGKQVARDTTTIVEGMSLTVEVGKANAAFPDKPPYLLATP